MTILFEKIGLYLSYPFVRYALIVGVLIALCSSLLGVTLVLKRFSFIGDGLSHVAFGAMAVAGVLHFANSPFQRNLFSLHGLDFPGEDPLPTRWHVGQPCGIASGESLEGMPLIP